MNASQRQTFRRAYWPSGLVDYSGAESDYMVTGVNCRGQHNVMGRLRGFIQGNVSELSTVFS